MTRVLILTTVLAVTLRSSGVANDTGKQLAPPVTQPYRMELLWWPAYCHEHRSDVGCKTSSRRQFVLGSLLPIVNGTAVSACVSSQETPKPFYPGNDVLFFIPDRELARKEWLNYGSCSGLQLAEFFRRVVVEFQRVHIPDEFLSPAEDVVVSPARLKQDFMSENPKMNIKSIRVKCRGGLLLGVELLIGAADSSGADCKEPTVTANVRMPLYE